MNSLVLLLAPAGNASTPPAAPKFPDAARQAQNSQGFSAALDRAVHHSPERKASAESPGRSRSNRGDAGREPAVRGERSEPLRGKSKGNQRDEEQSLAGACAVNGQAIRPEEPPQPTAASNTAGADEGVIPVGRESAGEVSVAGDETPSAVAGSGDGVEGEAASGNPALLTETTSPPAELETLLKPTTAAGRPEAEASEVAETLPQPTLEAATGLPEQSKVTSAIAAAVGTAGASPTLDESAANPLTTAAGAEVVKEIAPTSDEARRTARATRRSLTEALENARGIGGAKSTATMKTANNKEEIAGLSQQLLPGSPLLIGSTLSNLPGEGRGGAPGGVSPADALQAAAKLSPAPTRADVLGEGELMELQPSSALVRTSELISREVRMFKRSADDLVEVVLTPDSKTQISLRLQWREGQVEVQARCDLGDHPSLNQHWPQLQAAMAQHGVRLSHLSERTPTGFTEFFNNPSFSQQQGGERRPSANSGSAEHTLPTAPQPARSGAGKAGSHGSRLLESWA